MNKLKKGLFLLPLLAVALGSFSCASPAEPEPASSESVAQSAASTSSSQSTPASSSIEDEPIGDVFGGTFYKKFRQNAGESYELPGSDYSPDPVLAPGSDEPALINDLYWDGEDGSTHKLTSIGKLEVGYGEGRLQEYFGRTSIFLTGSRVAITFKRNLPSRIYDEYGSTYSVYDDEVRSIFGHEVGNRIGTGALIILKSYDHGTTWRYDGVSYVHMGNTTITYTPDGDDLLRGTVYRLACVSKLKVTKTVKDNFLWWETSKEVDFYMTLIQEHYIGIYSDVLNYGFYSSDCKYELTEEQTNENSTEAYLLNAMTALADGSITFNSITYRNNGQENLICKYRHNDGEPQYATNNQVFDAKGKYEFDIWNPYGSSRKETLYVLDSEDLYSLYFGEGLLPSSRRVFHETSAYPAYMTDVTLNVKPDLDYLPPVSGQLYKAEGSEWEPCMELGCGELKQGVTLHNEGTYLADLYVGGSASGQKLNFRFFFTLVDWPDYQPEINYNLLTGSYRKNNLSLKAYSVRFVTTLGGAYVFLFPATLNGYDQASMFAYNMEKRFVETYQAESGSRYYYYRGQRYDSKVELYAEMEKAALANVSLTYTNPTEEYGVQVLSSEELQHIEQSVLDHDVRVCVNEATRDALKTEETIINGFQFAQIAPYESASVTLVNESGDETPVPYDTPIDEILSETGTYTVKESNWFSTRTYQVNFIAPGDNAGRLNLRLYEDGQESSRTVTMSDDESVFSAEYAEFSPSIDPYDSQTLVVITKPGFRATYLLREVHGFVSSLSEAGQYQVKIINRFGTSYSFRLNLTGRPPIEGEEIEED